MLACSSGKDPKNEVGTQVDTVFGGKDRVGDSTSRGCRIVAGYVSGIGLMEMRVSRDNPRRLTATAFAVSSERIR